MPADLAVIGLGHLGLPLAQAAVAGGIPTIGYDPVRATDLAGGRLPCDGRKPPPPTSAGCSRGASGRPPTPSNSGGSAPPSSAPPPRRRGRRARPGQVADAAHTLAARLRPHTTVILESPVYPGTTEEFLRPILE